VPNRSPSTVTGTVGLSTLDDARSPLGAGFRIVGRIQGRRTLGLCAASSKTSSPGSTSIPDRAGQRPAQRGNRDYPGRSHSPSCRHAAGECFSDGGVAPIGSGRHRRGLSLRPSGRIRLPARGRLLGHELDRQHSADADDAYGDEAIVGIPAGSKAFADSGCPATAPRSRRRSDEPVRRGYEARYRRRRRWCHRGALPILCVVRARGVERVQDGGKLDRIMGRSSHSRRTKDRPDRASTRTLRHAMPTKFQVSRLGSARIGAPGEGVGGLSCLVRMRSAGNRR
jgi:hypothetical protein